MGHLDLVDASLLASVECAAAEQLPRTEDRFAVRDPASGLTLAVMAKNGKLETQQAIVRAADALKSWRKTLASERSELLRSWASLVKVNRSDLAKIISFEQGKPLLEAQAEILSTAAFLEWFAEEARRVDGEILQPTRRGQRHYVLKEAIGVCAAITPWNFPSSMIARKVAPALAAGCTVIVKPAEQTPLSAFALAELAKRAGIPDGVLTVVCGHAEAIGKELCDSDVVKKLSFTGSTRTGRVLMAQCAGNIKKLSLELGGNAPLIVFDDADLDAAVAGAIAIKFRNTGQMCICVNRIYVQAGIYEDFLQKFKSAVESLRVGRGDDAEVHLGPLINTAALEKVESHVADALAKGAQLVLGGRRHALGQTFYEPTVMRDVSQDALLAHEETFGPVAAVFKFKTVDEALAHANDTPYGLSAYFYTQDVKKVWAVTEELEFGMVGVNTVAIANEVGPFGGIKQAGLGREGSRHGIAEYLELKYVCMAA